MALGDPITVNLDGTTFLMDAETGGIIQSGDRSVESKEKLVFDASVGYTIGFVDFDFSATQAFSAVLNGTTGIAIASPGVALTLANDLGVGTNKNGVNAGGLFTRSIRISHQGEDLRMISGTTVQRKGIPAPES